VSVPAGAEASRHYVVSTADSVLTFEARSTLHPVRGQNASIAGYIDADSMPVGTLVLDPTPAMHIDMAVEGLTSGNAMLDQQMWKLIDSKRFPRISADLRGLAPGSSPGRFSATGDVTLAGRVRSYEGELVFGLDPGVLVVDGDLVVDIRDFGLTPPSLLILRVDPVVKVHLHLVAKVNA
jgi:hypothetical protein